MNNKAFRVVGIQIIVAITSAITAYFLVNFHAAESIIWGAIASMTNSSMLEWRIREKVGERSAGDHLKSIYLASLERYVVVGMMLVTGLKFLGLAPLLVVAGFVVGQVGMIAARLLLNGIEN